MRQELGFAIVINSGYRCPEHNVVVKGSKDSQHMLFATDVRPGWAKGVDDEEYLKRLSTMKAAAIGLDFKGIGEYTTFIHLDLREERARWKG